MTADRLPFERAAQLFPQPVAIACGRLCRARGPQEELDAALRAGEVLTRYLAALALCSVTSRASEADVPPLADFGGNLSFGKFLSVVQWAAGLSCPHPLKPFFDKATAGATWDAPLIDLLELRNELGHDLLNISEARARSVLKKKNPLQRLADALGTFAPLLELPLFVFEGQELERKKLKARRLLLMSESLDPLPEEIEVEGGLDHTRTPYIAVNGGCIHLQPALTWDVAPAVATYALYFIDKIDAHRLVFQTLVRDETEREVSDFDNLPDFLKGGRTGSLEPCTGKDKQSFVAEWRSRRRAIEQRLSENSARIPWDELDASTTTWFAKRLLGNDVAESDARTTLISRLLDGRDLVQPKEMRELRLLFGSRKTVRETLQRVMLDCRVRRKSEGRWDERIETEENVLQSLRVAIEFFAKHAGVAGASIDGLTAVTGSADYVAMREALVNLFIHQDYADQRTPAQIELGAERAVFFNAGKSLVGEKALAEGGRSQARNPLIARALRLIHFAELAGSGLRELHRVWGAAGRVPPKVESSSAANTFSLVLDWRPLPQDYDDFWRSRIGVKISTVEARVLELCAAGDDMTLPRIAAALGQPVDDVAAMLDRLVVNALLQRRKEAFVLVEHLREHAKQRGRST
jgi:ATP-dependent DNA helicase recG-like protein